MAEVAEKSVKKGSQLYIVGKIKTRSYVDKDGNNKYITEILADTFLVLDKKPGTVSAPSTPEQNKGSLPEKEPFGQDLNEPPASYQPTNEDDLPF
jgi:single-strand DNA-binding protein